jgi:hypothetical protein
VELMGEGRNVYRVLVGEPKGKRRTRKTEALMGFEWILGKLAGRVWCGFTWLRIGTDCGLLLTR